jgi:hypothetical protein
VFCITFLNFIYATYSFVSIFQSLFLFLPNYYATWKVGNIKILNVRKNIRHYCNCTSIGCINEIKKSNAKHSNIYVQPLKSWFVQNIHVSLHPYIFLREKKKWNRRKQEKNERKKNTRKVGFFLFRLFPLIFRFLVWSFPLSLFRLFTSIFQLFVSIFQLFAFPVHISTFSLFYRIN